jgi:hypothetical protein
MFPAIASREIPELNDAFRNYVDAHDRWVVMSENEQPRDEFARLLTLERVLREEVFTHGLPASPTLSRFRRLNDAALRRPGRAVRALSDMMTRQRNLVVVTVNFDQLVETIGSAKVFASDEDFKRCPTYLRQYHQSGGPIPVLKLHGTIERPQTIVATVDATIPGLSAPKTQALQTLVNLDKSCNCPVPWNYVGCSMRDPDLESLLAQPAFYQRVDERWVSPFTVTTALQFTERHRVYSRDQPNFWHRSITQTADVFLEELAWAWRT